VKILFIRTVKVSGVSGLDSMRREKKQKKDWLSILGTWMKNKFVLF